MARILLAVTMGLWLSGSHGAAAQFFGPGFGSAQVESPPDKPAGATEATRAAAPSAISTSAIPARSREADARLQDARRLLDGLEVRSITSGLPGFLEETAELARTTSTVTASTERRDLDDLLLRWDVFSDRMSDWQRLIERRSDRLDRQAQSISYLQQSWSLTRQNLGTQPDAPRAALVRADEVLREMTEAHKLLGESSEQLFELHERLQAAEQSVSMNIERLRGAQTRARELLLEPSRPVWTMFTPSAYPDGRRPPLAPDAEYVSAGVRAFWHMYGRRLPFDALLLAVFLSGTLVLAKRARRRARAQGQPVPDLLEASGGSALLLALICARLFYPRALSSIDELVGIASLATLFVMAPALVQRAHARTPMKCLIGVLGLHRLLLLLHLEPPWHELGLASIAVLLFAALWSTRRRLTAATNAGDASLDRTTTIFARTTFLALTLALLAGVFGRVALFRYLVDGVAGACYWLLLSIALTRVLATLIQAGLGTKRVQTLRSMQHHGDIIEARALRGARFFGITLCVVTSLHAFGLFEPGLTWLEQLLSSSAHVGSWSISLGDLGRFALTMVVAAQTARLVGFSLDEDILPKLHLARGVPSTVSRLTRYVVLALGFIFAVGAAGVDLSKMALLASALSVGIGFGLQTIVNNFVSGLLLIFERPVRVGDTIEIADLVGEVRSIGIRSSTIRTTQGAEVILPNADLISNRVINWTLSDTSRRVDIPIGVAYGTDPKQVLELLKKAVEGVDGIARTPQATCLFSGCGESSLDFELRLWVSHGEDWPLVRSAAFVAMHAKLCEAGIEIPFPQRDLHLRSVDKGALEALQRPPTEAGVTKGTES